MYEIMQSGNLISRSIGVAIFIFLNRSLGIMQSANLISIFMLILTQSPKSRRLWLDRSMLRSGAICIDIVSFRTIFANYPLVLVTGGDLSCDNLVYNLDRSR
jgi:hypothetical protein